MRLTGPAKLAGALLVTLAMAGVTGTAAPAAVSAQPAAAVAKKAAPKKGSKAARKAKALKRCRKIKVKAKRRACIKRVKRKFRPNKPNKPAKPVFKGDTYYVEVGDDYFAPTAIEIKSGDAVVWQWLDHNKDDHNVSMFSGPAGVNPLDFEMSDAPAVGPDWRRVFKVKGTYLMGCSLHHLQRITIIVK